MDVPNPEKTHKMWENIHGEQEDARTQEPPRVKTQEFPVKPDPVEQFKKRLEEVKRNPPEQRRRTRPLPTRPIGGPVDTRWVDMGDGPGSGVAAFGFGVMLFVSLFPYIAGGLLFLLVCAAPGLIWRGLKRGVQRLTGHKTREQEPKPIQTNIFRNPSAGLIEE